MDCIIKIPEHLDITIDVGSCPSLGSVFYVSIKDIIIQDGNSVSVLRSVPLGWIVNHESDDFSNILKKAAFTFSANYPTYVVGKLIKTKYKDGEKYKYLPNFFISNGNQL